MHLSQVLLIAIAAATTMGEKPESKKSSPILVEVYYESLCPDSRDFLTTQLYPTWHDLNGTGLLSVRLYPYGNAHQSVDSDSGSWSFRCQHGHRECEANILQACLIQLAEGDINLFLPAIACMEEADDPAAAAKQCIRLVSKLNFEDVTICSKGSEGNRVYHELGLKTEEQKIDEVPFVVVDGRHTDEMQKEAEDDLMALVCRLLKEKEVEKIPAVCQTNLLLQSLFGRAR